MGEGVRLLKRQKERVFPIDPWQIPSAFGCPLEPAPTWPTAVTAGVDNASEMRASTAVHVAPPELPPPAVVAPIICICRINGEGQESG